MVPGKQIVIPKEQATFWMDRRGRWCNEHGLIEHPKIAAHFHRSIRRDSQGYHLYQDHGTHTEKVYFRYEDTALFVWDLQFDGQIVLVLNTGRRIALDPRGLTIRGDDLYYAEAGERIKFGADALVKLAPYLGEAPEDGPGRGLSLTYEGRSHPIRAAK